MPQTKWQREHPEAVKAILKRWRKNNPERVKQQRAKQYAKNREKAIAASKEYYRKKHPNVGYMKSAEWLAGKKARRAVTKRAWRLGNPEKVSACKKRYRKKYVGRICADVVMRKAWKRKAVPKWANKFFMEEAYALAKLRTKILGFRWHVDHIVPMKSVLVCGLHVHNNLQVIPAIENLQKHNKIWPNKDD